VWARAKVSAAPAKASGANSPAYPLKVSPNGRFLVDQNSTSFLIVGCGLPSVPPKPSLKRGGPRDSGRDARTTPHAATPSAAGPLFSRTFSLCSGDFGVWAAFSSAGLSVLASSPTTLLSSSAARSSASRAGAVREPPLRRPAHGHASAGSYTLNSEGRLSVRRSHSREEITTIDDAGG
jgi:hypothetical protein